MPLDWISQHREVLFWLRMVPTVLSGGYLLQRYVTAFLHRPRFRRDQVIYQEYFASGSSQRNFLTRLGGASRCLRLVVTDQVLWVTSWFPFSLIAAAYDLEHVVPLGRIRSVQGKQSFGVPSLLLTFTDDQGSERSLRLAPKNQTKFLAALQASPVYAHAVDPPTFNVLPAEPALSTSDALRKYWHHLLAVALFPTVFFVGGANFHLPFGLFVPLFFGVIFYGAWPTLTKRAPYTYQLIMGAVWLGGGLLGGMVSVFVSFLQRPR